MAKARLIPANGAVVYGSLVADFASFDITCAQIIEDVTSYGAEICTENAANGTPGFTYDIVAYAFAHAASTAPNFGTSQLAGLASTLTLDTGVTEAAMFLQRSFRAGHSRTKAAVPFNISCVNAGENTETWAVS